MVVQGDQQMARTTKQTKTPATPGFAIEIKDDTELGLAILVAEFGDGNHQPAGVVVSINEAREIAESHWPRPAAGRRVAAADDLRPGTPADGGRQGLQRPRARVRHAASTDRPGRVPGVAAPVVA